MRAWPAARIDRRVAITMSPRHGMPMIVTPRQRPVTRGHVRGNIREMVDLE